MKTGDSGSHYRILEPLGAGGMPIREQRHASDEDDRGRAGAGAEPIVRLVRDYSVEKPASDDVFR